MPFEFRKHIQKWVLAKSFFTVKCAIALSIVSISSLSQHSQIGHPVKVPLYGRVIPLLKTREHGVSFQPFKMGDLAMMSGLNSVKVLELNYENKFNLIKHDFKSNTNTVYNFAIHKLNRFKAYCFDEDFFYALSKNYVEGRLQYYLDVIDLNSFEHRVKNKLIIKYMSRRDQDIALFQKSSNSLILVLENRILENRNKLVEVFLLDSKHAVEKHHEEKIPTSSAPMDFGGFYDWGNSCSIMYNDRGATLNDSGLYSYCYILKFDTGGIKQQKFISPPNQYILASVLQDSVTLVSLTTSKSNNLGHPDAISMIPEDASEYTVVELPYVFTSKLQSFESGSFSSDVNYKFTQFKDQLYLVETYKTYYQQNGTLSYKYGPGLLLKFDDKNELDWFLDLDDLRVNRIWPYLNLACIQSNENDLYLFYATHTGIELQQVDTDNGSLVPKPVNLEGKWLRSNLHGFQFNPETNSALILLIKNWSAKPFYLSF